LLAEELLQTRGVVLRDGLEEGCSKMPGKLADDCSRTRRCRFWEQLGAGDLSKDRGDLGGVLQ
jgi:hypothetical protein